MATTTLPREQDASRGRWIAGGVALIVLAILAALGINGALSRPAASGPATVAVGRQTVVATVSGSGAIAAAQTLDLSFQSSGSVTEVLVAEGDAVAAGQPLARVDTRDLELQVASAEAALASARAQLAQAESGDATQPELDAQAAAVDSARAQLRSAQAQLAALKRPSPSAISSAEAAVRKAELALQAQSDNSSASKTRAEQDLQKAVDALTQAQSKYATAKGNWEFVRDTNQDPTNPETRDASGEEIKNTLSDTQRQQYYDTFVQAEAALRSAEAGVQQAQVSYDNARQAEVNNIQTAEATLADAQAQLAALRSPTATDLAQRQASVDQAEASLAQAEANMAKLTAAGTPSDIAIRQASVDQAEQSLRQAELRLSQATLTAPFNATVSDVAIVPGSVVSSAAPAFSLINRNPLHIDLKLSENDVAQVRLGQPVALTIDALQGWVAQGTVSYIAPAAETANNVVTYAVRVTFSDSDERVKVGMTANLDITTATSEGALVVPNSALLPKGAGRVVQVLGADGAPREVDVAIGLSDGVNTEILSGLSEGDRVVESPATAEQQSGGMFP